MRDRGRAHRLIEVAMKVWKVERYDIDTRKPEQVRVREFVAYQLAKEGWKQREIADIVWKHRTTVQDYIYKMNDYLTHQNYYKAENEHWAIFKSMI